MRITPSYNTMAFLGILLGVTGAFRLKQYPAFALPLLAAGGVCTFLAKPTSAVLLGIFVFFYLWMTTSISLRWTVTLFVLVLLLLAIAAFLTDRSWVKFFERFRQTAEISQTISPMYSFWGVLKLSWPPIKLRQLLLGGCLVLFFVWLGKKCTQPGSKTPTLLASAVALLIVAINQGGLRLPAFWIDEIGLQVLAFPVAAMVLFGSQTGKNPYQCPGLPEALLLLLLPYVYVFGTGRAYWDNMPGACYFWFLAALPFLMVGFDAKQANKILVVWTMLFLLMGSCIFSIAEKNPYRQNQALSAQTAPFKLPGTRVGVRVEQGRANYFNELKAKAAEAGLSSGTFVIDLTGASPGVSVVLGLIPLGNPWLMGGYEGSNQVAEILLKKSDRQQLNSAWILWAPNSRRQLDPAILKAIPLDFPEAYELAFTVVLPAGKNYPLQPIRQEFYRPR